MEGKSFFLYIKYCWRKGREATTSFLSEARQRQRETFKVFLIELSNFYCILTFIYLLDSYLCVRHWINWSSHIKIFFIRATTVAGIGQLIEEISVKLRLKVAFRFQTFQSLFFCEKQFAFQTIIQDYLQFERNAIWKHFLHSNSL